MLNLNSNISKLLVYNHTSLIVLKNDSILLEISLQEKWFPSTVSTAPCCCLVSITQHIKQGDVQPQRGWCLRAPKWPHLWCLWGCIKQLRLDQTLPVKPPSHLVVRDILTNGNDIWDQSSPHPSHKYIRVQKMGMESRQQGMEENKTIYIILLSASDLEGDLLSPS